MKPFETYQYLKGEAMTERDKKDKDSKFWNEGKWEHFIKPLLSDSRGTFIDVGCNAGVYLELAKEYGFERVIGVEPNKGAFDRAVAYRDKHKLDYEIINKRIEDCADELPLADVVLLANTHYYMNPEDWIEYVNKLRTRYCIIVTAKKIPNTKKAPSDEQGIKYAFREWKQDGQILKIEEKDDLHPRDISSFCFKSDLERVPVDSLDNGNGQQKDFLKQLDACGDPLKTDYYKRLKDYRKKTTSRQQVWSDKQLNEYMQERLDLYNEINKNGMMEPILVKEGERISDGNHRHDIIRYLGNKSIIIKRV